MSDIRFAGSGGYDALSEQVNDNTTRSEDNKSKNTEQDLRLDQAETDIQDNTDAINELEGSLEVKSYLTVSQNVAISLSTGILSVLVFIALTTSWSLLL